MASAKIDQKGLESKLAIFAKLERMEAEKLRKFSGKELNLPKRASSTTKREYVVDFCFGN